MKIKCSKCSNEFEMPDNFCGRIVCEDCDLTMQGEKTNDDQEPKFIQCEHFWLPAQIKDVEEDRYYNKHFLVERVYCAKCGKNCYADLSDLK